MRITLISSSPEIKALFERLDNDLYQVVCFDSVAMATLEIASGPQVLVVDDRIDIDALQDLNEQLEHTLPHMIWLKQEMDSELLDRLYALGLDDVVPLAHADRLLLKKLESVSHYYTRMAQLSIDYEFAHNTAMEAMATSSELGQVMKFVEQSYTVDECQALAGTLFATTDALGLNCVLSLQMNGEAYFFSSKGEVKPLEEQLLLAAKNQVRFHDLGIRTVLNYPNASLLIKNMPVDDANRYGRIKDALPVLLGALDAKMASISTESLIRSQTEELGSAFDVIKYSFLHLNELMSEKIKSGNQTMSSVLHDLSFKLPSMGLEEDQEEYILDQVETVMDDSSELLVAEREMSEIFDSIRDNLHQLVGKQNQLLEVLMRQKQSEERAAAEPQGEANIELF
jgi:hypothetical protein